MGKKKKQNSGYDFKFFARQMVTKCEKLLAKW